MLKCKKIFVVCLFVLSVMTFLFGFVLSHTASATGETKTVNQISFVMEKGAFVRIDEDNVNGLKFEASISTDDYTALMNNIGEGKAYKSVSFGMIIAPKNYVSVSGKELTVANLFGPDAIYDWSVGGVYSGSKVRITNLPSERMKLEDDKYIVGGALTNLKDGTGDDSVNNIPRDFVGLGYIKYTNSDDSVGYKLADYVDDDIANGTRSMAYVAQVHSLNETSATIKNNLKTTYLDKITNEQAVSSIINDGDFSTTNYVFPSLYSGLLDVEYVQGHGIKITHNAADTNKVGTQFSSALLKAAANKGYTHVEINMERDGASDPWVNVDGKSYRNQTGTKNFFAGNLAFGNAGGTTVQVKLLDCKIDGEYQLYFNLWSGYFVIDSRRFIYIEPFEGANFASNDNISVYTGNVNYLTGLGMQCRNEVEFDSDVLKQAADRGYTKLVIVLCRDTTNINPWVNVDGKDHRNGTNVKNFYAGNLALNSAGGTTVNVTLADCLINGEYKLFFNTWSDYYIINSAVFSKS